MRLLKTIYGLVVVVSLSGCAGKLSSLQPPSERIELTSVLFVAQTTDQCGPAALSMVLSHSGVYTDLEELRRRVHLPDRKGSLQLELIAATRQYGRVAYASESQLDELFGLVEDGYPVIVLQNVGARWLPIWHYAVVVGYEPESDQVIMRSGNTKRKLMRRSEFAKRWSASNYWELVVLAPDDIPLTARPETYLQAVSAHETLAQWDIARTAYAAAIKRWPDNPIAHLGWGNVQLGSGSLEDAIGAYHTVLGFDATNLPALNNLVYAYAENSEPAKALALIDRALAASTGHEQVAADLRMLRVELTEPN